MWRLLPDESVAGDTPGGKVTLEGPMVVRVHEFPAESPGEQDLMSVQGGDMQIQVDGLDFEAVVEKK